MRSCRAAGFSGELRAGLTLYTDEMATSSYFFLISPLPTSCRGGFLLGHLCSRLACWGEGIHKRRRGRPKGSSGQSTWPQLFVKPPQKNWLRTSWGNKLEEGGLRDGHTLLPCVRLWSDCLSVLSLVQAIHRKPRGKKT